VNPMGLAELNRCVSRFGEQQKAFMRSENRTSLRSVLFDVPRRSSLGWYCYYQKAPALLRELVEHVTPEEIGYGMKCLCSRPNYLQLSILMCSYFGARQQLIIDNGPGRGQPAGGDRLEDTRFVVDFWRRVCRQYRNDGSALPDPGKGTQEILPAADVQRLSGALTPFDEARHQSLRRLAATLELYAFILHGEQRDGLFAHGPYALGDGSELIVQEFNDLKNEYLPWARTGASNPYPALALVRRTRGLGARFDLFGGVHWQAPDIAACVEAEGLFARARDGHFEAVPFTQAGQIEASAAAAQNELFLKAAEWSPRYKAEYGVHLFANHLFPFFGGLPRAREWGERIRSEFQAAAAGVLDGLLADDDVPSIWQFMATTEGAFYSPLAAPA